MKTRLILTMALAMFTYCAWAQKAELTKPLAKDEVPVVVAQALQKDFTNLTEKGNWRLIYLEDVKTTKLTPELYEYACKKDGEWVEIFFKPDGSLDHTKGINAQMPTHTDR